MTSKRASNKFGGGQKTQFAVHYRMLCNLRVSISLSINLLFDSMFFNSECSACENNNYIRLNFCMSIFMQFKAALLAPDTGGAGIKFFTLKLKKYHKPGQLSHQRCNNFT